MTTSTKNLNPWTAPNAKTCAEANRLESLKLAQLLVAKLSAPTPAGANYGHAGDAVAMREALEALLAR